MGFSSQRVRSSWDHSAIPTYPNSLQHQSYSVHWNHGWNSKKLTSAIIFLGDATIWSIYRFPVGCTTGLNPWWIRTREAGRQDYMWAQSLIAPWRTTLSWSVDWKHFRSLTNYYNRNGMQWGILWVNARYHLAKRLRTCQQGGLCSCLGCAHIVKGFDPRVCRYESKTQCHHNSCADGKSHSFWRKHVLSNVDSFLLFAR